MIVTGGKGFIGTNFINKYGGESFDIKDGQDITNYLVSEFYLKEDIIHLAAESGIPFSIDSPIISHESNSVGAFNAIESARVHDKKIVLASSAAAENCSTPYAAFKRAGELYAKAYHETYGLEYTVLRFANVYGPYSMHKTSVVAQMCKDALTKGEITVNGDCYRDFIHVDDVCMAIKKYVDQPVNDTVYIGSGVMTPVYEVAKLISKETRADIIHDAPRIGDVKNPVVSAGQLLISHYSLEQGILETLEWFRENI